LFDVRERSCGRKGARHVHIAAPLFM